MAKAITKPKSPEPAEQLRFDSKEKALPAGNWGIAPFTGDTLIAHQDYVIHTEPPFRYKFEDIVSFISYCDTNIEPSDGIIFYTDNEIIGLHSWLQPAGNRIRYDFELSPELLAWKGVRNFSHKRFRSFLEERLDELIDATIFTTLATLKMNTTIHFEPDFDDDRNYGFIYQEKEGKRSSKIPKELTIIVPLFTGDPPQKIPLHLNVVQPKDPDARLRFTIEIFREERLLADNVTALIEKLRKALPDHMILHDPAWYNLIHFLVTLNCPGISARAQS